MPFIAEPVPPSGEMQLTIADLAERWGRMPLDRIRVKPFPFVATEQDVIDAEVHEERLFELIDGVLLEKTYDLYDSWLTLNISSALSDFVSERKSGIVLGPSGSFRLRPGCIRLPDVSFVSWDRLPRPLDNTEYFLSGSPDLAIEIVNERNTKAEMASKLDDYFDCGTRLVWYVNPSRREVHVFSAVDAVRVLKLGEILDGGDILPGFRLELSKLFVDPTPKQA